MATERVLMPDTEGSGDLIEYCISVGDKISIDDPILVIESDKASMEVPSSVNGIVKALLLELGSSVEKGDALIEVEVREQVGSNSEQILTDELMKQAEHTQNIIHQNDFKNEETCCVLMPEMESKGDVIELCKQIGDTVLKGETIVVIESDKASMEVPSSVTGRLTKWLVKVGDAVITDSVLIELELTDKAMVSNPLNMSDAQLTGSNDEKLMGSNDEKLMGSNDEKLMGSNDEKLTEPTIIEAIQHPISLPMNIEDDRETHIHAGPVARRLARELGVTLSHVQGTGRRSKILKEDIRLFVKQTIQTVESKVQITGSAIPAMPNIDFSQFGPIEEQALSGMAKATMQHMTRCWLNIPHVTLFDDVDISALDAFRTELNHTFYGLDKKPSILPFIIKVVAKALREYPQFNSSLHLDGDKVIQKDYVHIGIAVDSPAGLVVPVIRDADKKSISELAREVAALALKAKERKLKPADMQGGCFTVSSLGARGGKGFTPIINGPEVAILGVAKAEVMPVWNGSTFVPVKKVPLSLSFDHRVINGGEAGEFMSLVNVCLSNIGNVLM